MLPPDPLRDHRRRHRRIRRQQFPDPRLRRVGDRSLPRPLILRRPVTGDRCPHRVPRDPHHPGDHLDRHLLRPVQPADLSPVLHAKHPFHPLARLEPESSGRGSKFRCHAGVSIHVPPTVCRRSSPLIPECLCDQVNGTVGRPRRDLLASNPGRLRWHLTGLYLTRGWSRPDPVSIGRPEPQGLADRLAQC